MPTSGVGFRCEACRAKYPPRAGVPVLLNDEEWRACQAYLERERAANEQYDLVRRTVPLTLMYYDAWIARMLAEIPPTLGGPLVELMCGGAEICRRLPARFPSAFALDINVTMVEQAARDLQRVGAKPVTVVCGTAARLPLPDACTEIVIVQGALHHARPLLSQVLSEITRILKPNGVFIGSEPANDHPLIRGIRHWQYRHSHLQGNDPDEDGFSRPELADRFAAAGLSLDRYQRFGFIAYPLMGNTDILPVLSRSRSTTLGRGLLALDRLLEHVPVIRGLAWASLFRAFKRPPAGSPA